MVTKAKRTRGHAGRPRASPTRVGGTSAVAGRSEYPLGPALAFLQTLWRVNHVLESLSSRMDRDIGVTAQQRLIVRCLGKFPDLPAGQLAVMLHVDPSTVSVAIRRLTDKGVVERRLDPEDKRFSRLRLTPKGRALDKPTRGTVEGAVDRLLAAESPRALAATVHVLEALSALVEEELADG